MGVVKFMIYRDLVGMVVDIGLIFKWVVKSVEW